MFICRIVYLIEARAPQDHRLPQKHLQTRHIEPLARLDLYPRSYRREGSRHDTIRLTDSIYYRFAPPITNCPSRSPTHLPKNSALQLEQKRLFALRPSDAGGASPLTTLLLLCCPSS